VRQAALKYIFVTILLDVLSLGLLIPILPTLIEQKFVDGNTVRAAQVAGQFAIIWAMMQFVFSPIMGSLSDKYGRRRVILISCFGLGLDYILMALAPNLTWLFVGRILSGITAASFSTAAAYVADVTPPEKRAASYGMYVGAAWGIGFVLGPAVGGLLGGVSLRLPLWCAAGLTLANAIYGYFILPESLPPEKRSEFSWRKANPLGSLRLLRSQPDLLLLASLLLIYQLAHQVFQSVFVLYSTYRYSWSPTMVGLTLTAVGVLAVVMQAYVVRRTSHVLGEWRMVLIALATGAIGYAIYGLAPNGKMFWLAIPVFSLVGYFSPGLQALMTRRVGPESQGQLQGVNSSIAAIAGMVGPGVFTLVFGWAVRTESTWGLLGAPFFVAAVLHLLGIALFFAVFSKQQNPGPDLPEPDNR
jgi:MFS transporter, DHA1 family, tetracycline resistance protein